MKFRRAMVGVLGAMTVVVVTLGVSPRQSPSEMQRRGLPQDMARRLMEVKKGMLERAQKVQEDVDFLEKSKGRLLTLRQIVESNAKARSTKSGGLLLLAVDGLVISNGLLQTGTQLNRDSFRILGTVAAGILDGDGYLKLDKALLMLEQSEAKREEGLKTLSNHQDRIDAIMTLGMNAPDSDIVREELAAARAALSSQRLRKNEVVNNYDSLVKPGTRSLRRIVDQLPKL